MRKIFFFGQNRISARKRIRLCFMWTRVTVKKIVARMWNGTHQQGVKSDRKKYGIKFDGQNTTLREPQVFEACVNENFVFQFYATSHHHPGWILERD